MSADLLELIGRRYDAYKYLTQEVTLLEVSPEADVEIKRLLRKNPEQRLAVLKIDQELIPYTVNPKFIGVDAWKLHTRLGLTSPAMAIAGAKANRSQN